VSNSTRDEIARLAAAIRALENELEAALAQRRIELNYRIEAGVARFEQALVARHRLVRASLARYLLDARPRILLTAPVIYSLIVPLVILDVFMLIYQAICFRAYGIPRVRRSDYLAFDRAQLQYLNVIEKFNCAYCSYANGLFAFVREVAARTEQYWCPIKHARRVLGQHSRYGSFVDYGDAEAYRQELEQLREKARAPISP
jgi:hypothetical protein